MISVLSMNPPKSLNTSSTAYLGDSTGIQGFLPPIFSSVGSHKDHNQERQAYNHDMVTLLKSTRY
jgi:hypothetical protein